MSKQIIGRTDKVDFPEFDLTNIDVKIDTGAYTSAIHCSQVVEESNGLRCTFSHQGRPDFNNKEVFFTAYSKTGVKSSNGHKENRFKIRSSIVLFGKTYKINLTLSTRDDMRFPVLIGRQFLKNKFLVDVSLENISFNMKTQ